MRQLLLLAMMCAVLGSPAWPSWAQQHSSDDVPFKYVRPELPGWTPADLYGVYSREGMPQPFRPLTVVRDLSETAHRFRDDAIGIAEAIQAHQEGCWYTQPFSFESATWDEEQIDTLDSLINTAVAIARGIVSVVEGGVLSPGGPGLLLQVEVKAWLKRAPDQAWGDVVHVFYPRGKFRIDDALICATAVTDFPTPPEQGAEILLFPQSLGANPAWLPMGDLSSRIAFETATGAQATPELRRVLEFRTISFQDLLRFTRDALRDARESVQAQGPGSDGNVRAA